MTTTGTTERPVRAWTVVDVAEWLEEAATTLKRLPDRERARLRSTGRSWPDMARAVDEAYGRSDAKLRLGPPSAQALDRLDAVLGWWALIPDETDRRLVFLWAAKVPQAAVADRFARSDRWVRLRVKAALLALAEALNKVAPVG